MTDRNQRQAPRTPVTLKIKFKSETLDQFIERYSVDVSPGGIFIRTKEPLAVGTVLHFEFQLRDASPLIVGKGTVVWTREPGGSAPGAAPGMGVRFDQIAGDSREVLEKIASRKTTPAGEKGGGAAEEFAENPTRVAGNHPGAPAAAQDDFASSEASSPTRVAPDHLRDALSSPALQVEPSPGAATETTGGAAQARVAPRRGTQSEPPRPEPMPFESDANEFDESAFKEATKVADYKNLAPSGSALFEGSAPELEVGDAASEDRGDGGDGARAEEGASRTPARFEAEPESAESPHGADAPERMSDDVAAATQPPLRAPEESPAGETEAKGSDGEAGAFANAREEGKAPRGEGIGARGEGDEGDDADGGGAEGEEDDHIAEVRRALAEKRDAGGRGESESEEESASEGAGAGPTEPPRAEGGGRKVALAAAAILAVGAAGGVALVMAGDDPADEAGAAEERDREEVGAAAEDRAEERIDEGEGAGESAGAREGAAAEESSARGVAGAGEEAEAGEAADTEEEDSGEAAHEGTARAERDEERDSIDAQTDSTALPRYVALESTPPDAVIEIDGERTGERTPAEVELADEPTGQNYQITLRRRGFYPASETVSADARAFDEIDGERLLADVEIRLRQREPTEEDEADEDEADEDDAEGAAERGGPSDGEADDDSADQADGEAADQADGDSADRADDDSADQADDNEGWEGFGDDS